MREVFAAFGSEVFRPVMTILLPGSVALAIPFSVLLAMGQVTRLFESYRIEGTIVAFLAALALGEVIEDLGSRVEARMDTMLVEEAGYENHYEWQWFDYLQLAFKVEPVGQRYLRTLVLRLKFELGMGIALFISALNAFLVPVRPQLTSVLFFCQLALSCYLVLEAFQTHKYLSLIRRELLRGIKLVPEVASQEEKTIGAAAR